MEIWAGAVVDHHVGIRIRILSVSLTDDNGMGLLGIGYSSMGPVPVYGNQMSNKDGGSRR